MSQIHLKGPFLWIWGAMFFSIWGIGFWGFLAPSMAVKIAVAIWGSLFIPVEIAGSVVNYWHRMEPEVARSFSQLMQYFAARDNGGPWWRRLVGFDGMVSFTALLVSILCGWVWGSTFALVNPALGWAVGVTVGSGIFGYNLWHWLNRRRNG